MRASAWTNARSSPDATAGMPPTRSNAATVTARLAPAASVCRGHGSAGIRIKPVAAIRSSNLGQLAFQRIVGVEMCRNECRLGGIERHPSAHQIGARRQGQEVALDPILRDDGIGVRCQKYAVGTRQFSGGLPCQPARIAGVGGHLAKVWTRMCSGYGTHTDSAWATAEVLSIQLLASRRTASACLVCRASAQRQASIRSASSLAGIATTVGRSGLIHR